MKIKWEVEDGYCGKSRPQEVDIEEDYILECESEQELLNYLYDEVDEDFENKITYNVNTSDIETILEFWKNNRDNEEEEDEE